jgi:hypothetical protein
MTQRLNVTIPDDLHARLEPLREQLNISRVCTTALQEAVERLTAEPDDDDPRVTEILDRLYEGGEFWYDRGYSEGETWALTKAARAQLQYHAERLAGLDATDLARRFREQEDAPTEEIWFPSPERMRDRLLEWIVTDQTAIEHGMPEGENPVRDKVMDVTHASADADLGSYLQGWRDAVVELWEKVERALKQSKGRRRLAARQVDSE